MGFVNSYQTIKIICEYCKFDFQNKLNWFLHLLNTKQNFKNLKIIFFIELHLFSLKLESVFSTLIRNIPVIRRILRYSLKFLNSLLNN